VIECEADAVRQAACMGDTRNVYNVLVGDPKLRDHFEDLGIDGKILER
jgi:hypothetical protein